jgi:hypothetical protein
MGRAALTFLKSIPQNHLLETTVHPNLVYLMNFAPRADALHLLHPPLLGLDTLKQLVNNAPVTDSDCGALNKMERSRENLYEVSGWTKLCDSQRSFDCVILCYVDRRAERVPFTLAVPIPGHSEWEASFLGTMIPEGNPYEIEAWAFDISRLRLYKLAGQHSFP